MTHSVYAGKVAGYEFKGGTAPTDGQAWIWDDVNNVFKPGEPVPRSVFYPHNPAAGVATYTMAAASNYGDWPTGSMTDAAKRASVYSGFFEGIPVAVYVVVIPLASGNLAWFATTDFAASTEAYNTNSDAMGSDGTPEVTTVTADMVTLVEVTNAFTGAAVGDFWGLAFVRDGDDAADTVGAVVHVLGLRVVYSTGIPYG